MSNRKIVNQWNSFFESRSVKQETIDQYMVYIKTLLENDVPIIFNFEHLSKLMGRTEEYLASAINSPEYHYREFKIKKRSGGFRLITCPYPALLEMQYWIYHNILKKVPIHSSAHGFTNKKSILTNSRIHAGNEQLLKLDLKDFFPSISINRMIYVFKKLGYPNIIAFYLASICSYEESLPQGAPTSPILSNIIANPLDKRLMNFAKKYNLNYSRYADDLTFSGKNVPAKLIDYVSGIINSEGFEVNKGKTRLYRNKGKRIVTGISVIEKEIKLPRKYKRDLKQELHYILKYGLESHVAKKRIRNANYLLSILGKINFWLSVEPKNEYAKNAKEKLLEYI